MAKDTVQAQRPANDAPKSANELLDRVDVDHNRQDAPIDMNSTGGIKQAIERNWRAIRALAHYIDGNVTGADGVMRNKAGKPVDSQGNELAETAAA